MESAEADGRTHCMRRARHPDARPSYVLRDQRTVLVQKQAISGAS
jgi:hypothetical protein